MFSFNNDYSEGACKQVMVDLLKTNDVQVPGYGLDPFCLTATNMIKQITGHNDIDVHYIPGGTPANILAISTLKSYEAVICADTGHINVHETGAVEATGHKILSVKNVNGKLTASAVEQTVLKHTDEHMVKPKMVFISNPSELGTIYSKQELIDLYNVCKKYNLYFYMDGARLANALVAQGNDVSIKDITDIVDMFYIGGTKNGALLGEAMVIKNNELKPNFRYLLKQHGSMLAKARIIGVSFISLLQNNLYYSLASNANNKAQQLKHFFASRGIRFFVDTPTNQIFPVLGNNLIKRLRQKYIFSDWEPIDSNNTAVRFVCSWATKQSDIDAFMAYFDEVA